MDSRKIINSSYLAAGIILWFLTRASIQYLYLTFYQVRRLPGMAVAREFVPVVVGLIGFIVLLKHPRINVLMEEVVSELRKVTWPAREDVVRSTMVVIICIMVAGFILSGFDILWGKVISFLLHS